MFCFIIGEDVVFIEVYFRLLCWSAMITLFNNDSTACQFCVTQQNNIFAALLPNKQFV